MTMHTQFRSWQLASSFTVFRFVSISVSIFFSLFVSSAQAWAPHPWLASEASLSLQKVVENISPPDGRPGAVIAAPSRHSPNYYFHWVRDAGIVMDSVVKEYVLATDLNTKRVLRRKLIEYLQFSLHIQNVPAPTGLGEPKFHVDGSAFTGPWGRPQNDGPALRAMSFIHWAKILIEEGEVDLVRELFYDSKLPSKSVIKRDLEFVSHRWQEPSFDLWEEVRGDHFYTRMVQRRALVEGAELARMLNDTAAAGWYLQQAKLIETDLMNFWDESRGYFIATRNPVEGLDYKHSQLDTAVILGLLHGSMSDGFLPFTDRRVQATLEKLSIAFSKTYAINQKAGIPGVAIGRYPEDRYGGANFDGGNPWPLCTLALAEAYYRATSETLRTGGVKTRAAKWLAQGDLFVERVRFHANADGSLSEQMDRNTGYMTSVPDLTWNYAAVLSTYWERNAATGTGVRAKRNPRFF